MASDSKETEAPKRPNLQGTYGVLLPMDALNVHVAPILKSIYPADLLYDDVIGHGNPIEKELHVTLAIGIADWDPKIGQMLADCGAFKIVVDQLGFFTNAPREIQGEMRSWDVLYARVDTERSPQLLKLHAQFAAVNKSEHKEYKPHITLAYMRYGSAAKAIAASPKFGPFEINVNVVHWKPYHDPKRLEFYIKLPSPPPTTRDDGGDVTMSDANGVS